MANVKASRPFIEGYGVPKSEEGMLSWSHVQERMTSALNYWVCTANASGQPHATPVWGVWIDDAFYFDGSPKTRRARDLVVNAQVSVHLEDGMNVVILEGEAREAGKPDSALAVRVANGYKNKYAKMGYAPEPTQWDNGGLYVMRPHLAFAWTKFPDDMTRWKLGE
ncbi:MAG: pyridoxamine 5'-phosphate oxidase family protein [Chloroflexi bacterium]|nr:pyridoxamine 5'-phosphate oxidase family protein [Chloroflexota bacterium]